jgi:hypothetical protein
VALVVQLIAATVLLLAPPNPRAASPTGPTAAPAPAPVVVADGRTVHLVSLGGPRTDGLLARIGGDIDEAVSAVEKFWGTDWDRDIVVIGTGSEAQFVAQAGLDPNRQWTDIAAVSVADRIDLEHHSADGQRIVFAPGAAAMSDASLRIVLTHELFHLAARADTAANAPRWLVEGVADFVARPPAPLPAAAGGDTALPTDAELDTAGPQRAMGYDRAWWFARFVAGTYGVDALRKLYVAAAGPHHTDFDTAVRSALDTDPTELRVRWARWLSR